MKVRELKALIQEAIIGALQEKHIGFDKLKNSLAHKKGVTDPGAVAASIGNKKYGKGAMQRAAHSGHSLEETQELDHTDPQFLAKFAQKLARMISTGTAGWRAATEMMLDQEFLDNMAHGDLGKLEQMAVDLGASPRRVGEACEILRTDLLTAIKDAQEMETLDESPPEGWHGTVAAMKQHHHTGPGKITNPYALANWEKSQGEHPHYKEQPTSKHGTPVKKKSDKE